MASQTQTYVKRFTSEDDANQTMRMKNRVSRDRTLFVLVDGLENDFFVMDLRSAIEGDFLYRWSI